MFRSQARGSDRPSPNGDAVRERGYGYFGVADHSQSAHYAGGLSLEEIAEQHAEIDRLNARYDGMFRIFKGIEADILADGSLDYSAGISDPDRARAFGRGLRRSS